MKNKDEPMILASPFKEANKSEFVLVVIVLSSSFIEETTKLCAEMAAATGL